MPEIESHNLIFLIDLKGTYTYIYKIYNNKQLLCGSKSYCVAVKTNENLAKFKSLNKQIWVFW